MKSQNNERKGDVRQGHSDKKLLFLMSIVVGMMIFDLTMVSVYGVISIDNDTRKILFAANACIILAAGHLLLSYTRPREVDAEIKKLNFTNLYRFTVLIYYMLSALMITIILQLFLNSYYTSLILSEIVLLCYGIAIAILSIFIFRTLRILTRKRNAIIIIVFLAALGAITINASITMLDIYSRISNWPPEIRFIAGTGDLGKGFYDILDNLYHLTYIVSFLSAWAAGATMLSYYARKMGKVKIWLVAFSPLVFFLGQFAPMFTMLFPSVVRMDPFSLAFLTTTITTLSKPIGGLMLAIVFWSMARARETNATVKNALIIAGFGFLLLFTSNQALLLSIVPFPPFGLPTVTIIGLSAYLLVIGVYTSSISISTDSELRQSIRKLAKSHLNLLDSMASADELKAVERRAVEIIKKESNTIAKKTGIESELDEDEIKEYLDEVIKEMQGAVRQSRANDKGHSA